jgi:alkanesulfonate monooxygenase SsuD/methylene tetrahydromethanopterin reductase-like flavin-dependent oxidoreductase (luciferase family)
LIICAVDCCRHVQTGAGIGWRALEPTPILLSSIAKLNDEGNFMKFGVFDHLDRGHDVPLKEYYEDRLKLIEAYERAGFYAYHIAEHHSTSLGMAPSPSVFLSAVAQRTSVLRFGPMVYALPLHHPLRLVEEICMLDQMSGGRLELGFGRGSSPVELEYFGQNPEHAERMYLEGIQIIRQGLTQKMVNFQGEFYRADNVPMELETLQKPLPPIWYGVHSPESAERSARKGFNILGLTSPGTMQIAFDRFRAVWGEAHGNAALPMIGIGRFVVVAATDEEALALGRRAYKKWHHSFTYLSKLKQRAQRIPRPESFDTLLEIGEGIAGSPETVARRLHAHVAQTGANYFVGQFAFGDMSLTETLGSLDLFKRYVMPEISQKEADLVPGETLV